MYSFLTENELYDAIGEPDKISLTTLRNILENRPKSEILIEESQKPDYFFSPAAGCSQYW